MPFLVFHSLPQENPLLRKPPLLKGCIIRLLYAKSFSRWMLCIGWFVKNFKESSLAYEADFTSWNAHGLDARYKLPTCTSSKLHEGDILMCWVETNKVWHLDARHICKGCLPLTLYLLIMLLACKPQDGINKWTWSIVIRQFLWS